VDNGIQVLFCFGITTADRSSRAFKVAAATKDYTIFMNAMLCPQRVFVRLWNRVVVTRSDSNHVGSESAVEQRIDEVVMTSVPSSGVRQHEGHDDDDMPGLLHFSPTVVTNTVNVTNTVGATNSAQGVGINEHPNSAPSVDVEVNNHQPENSNDENNYDILTKKTIAKMAFNVVSFNLHGFG